MLAPLRIRLPAPVLMRLVPPLMTPLTVAKSNPVLALSSTWKVRAAPVPRLMLLWKSTSPGALAAFRINVLPANGAVPIVSAPPRLTFKCVAEAANPPPLAPN